MIYCPICETANRDGSKFCNECGIKFGSQRHVKCPECGTLNAVGDLACAACGGRLPTPSTPEPDDSLHPAGVEADAPTLASDAPEVPAWLQDLPPFLIDRLPQSKEAGERQGPPDRLAEPGPLTSETSPEDGPLMREGMPVGERENDSPPFPHPDLEGERGSEPPLLVADGEDLLAGIQGTLPVEAFIAQPRAALADPSSHNPNSLQDAGAMSARASLFAEIVSPPPEVTPERAAQTWGPWHSSVSRWILFALFIAAVTLPLIVDRPIPTLFQEWLLPERAAVTRNIEAAPAVAMLYDQIESLDSGAPVLVAIDYDPSTVDEMDLLARAIVRHLMEQEARVVTVSLLPAGAATAQDLLEVMANEMPAYSSGDGRWYANLGYLPGQVAGIRLLGQSVAGTLPADFWGNRVADMEVMKGVSKVQDFDLIVEVAASPDMLRWWIEQASNPQNVPLVAGVSASLEPLARPYYETEPRQVVGLVAGAAGAAMYDTLYNAHNQTGDPQGRPESRATARLDSQLAGYMVFVLVILAGNGVYLVQRATGRERG